MKTPLFTVPVASTSFSDDATVAFDGGDLELQFSYRQHGGLRRWAVRFKKTRAFRHRGEPYCTAWHIEGVYDQVAELSDSVWLKELADATSEDQRGIWLMKHFMIYLDSFGCLEVISENAELAESP